MRAPLSSDVLAAWQQGASMSALEKTLPLLAMAEADTDTEELARLRVGERDARLMALRKLLFGSKVTAATECPECGETVELSFAIDDVTVVDSRGDTDASTTRTIGPDLAFRPPTTEDLVAAADAPDVAAARQILLQRCVDGPVNDDGVATAVALAMAAADPQADVRLALTCPGCEHRWRCAFDIASHLWAEVEGWVHRTAFEVHTLAAAYGWSESQIMALGPRRQLYLDLVRG